PGEIAAQARRQLEAYPTLTWREGRVESITGQWDAFEVTTADGIAHTARRILFASGVADQLPAVPGLAERWGQFVFHCPYCHGYELNQGRIGIVGSSPLSLHQAELLTEWGDVTLLVNGAVEVSPET
ncbi:NAD(P)/FAD-dependent oxidoreductase, partial [Raoultella terrigena]|uniref:NAD(P)/FAD-dependent oxidoreductase n=1 Tax=Raoultella terrigena TaxID=577 RepID=UPI0015F2DF06